jgi:hypothetical protein
MKFGPERMIEDLGLLGFSGERAVDTENHSFVVIRDFLIELGKFAGRRVDLGIPVPDNFPQGVAAAIHVRAMPQLYETTDSLPNVRNIVASKLGCEWRYWSKNFNWRGERSTRRLLSQINEIFLNC